MVNIDQINSDLMRSFNQNNVVLFVGTDGDKVMDDCLYNLPWSCVVTSMKNCDFGSKFSIEERKSQRYVKADDIPAKVFNKMVLPLIHIFGTDDSSNEFDYDDILLSRMAMQQDADSIINTIMKHMKLRSHMIIIGYNPSNPNEYSVEKFILSWKLMQGGRLTVFNTSEESDGVRLLKQYSLKKDFDWYDIGINQVFDEEYSDALKTSTQGIDFNKSIFYKGQVPVSIDKGILLRNQNFVQLLNEDKIYEIRPFGRIQQSRWFFNFLNNSSDSPQWYGYLPQSEFYLKRSYEDTLVTLVRNTLFSRNSLSKGQNCPIILQGDPGSSKSVELGALAYRIYNERINPVIFINNGNLSFSSHSPEFQQLDELMIEVERNGDKDTRILIIWDSSSYRNVAELANSLARQLDNRGRRFVLVCTAYSNSLDKSKKDEKDSEIRKWYKLSDPNHFVETSNTEGTVFYNGKNYYVTTTRHMNKSEIVKFKQKAKLYSVADNERLDKTWKLLEEQSSADIFDYFYRLISIIRPKLEKGLTKEQRKVNEYVEKQLSIIGGEHWDNNFNNGLVEALKALDLDFSDEDIVSEDDEYEEDYDLHRFNLCIALLSRFKIDTPYALAVYVLFKGKPKEASYSESNRELFELLTNSITFITYCENKDKDFIFKFRNTLEAELFVKNNHISVMDQIGIAIEMMDYYDWDYRIQGNVDLYLKNNIIQKYLRMLGPNTDYIPFKQGGQLESQHIELVKNLDKLIDKLRWFRKEEQIPDDDASFALIEITFTREYFGGQWDRIHGYKKDSTLGFNPWEVYPDIYDEDSYILRLERLQEASDLTIECINKIERLSKESDSRFRNEYSDVINSLTVELSLCNRFIEVIKSDYKEFCDFMSIPASRKAENIKPLSYMHQYEMLTRAIGADPLNGYVYNALFSLFEREYEKSNSQQRLERLSEVRMIADEVSMLDITNRGMNRDELSEHLAKIAKLSGDQKVTIDNVINNNCSSAFNKFFDEMLIKNNSAAICFVCQQELENAGLGGKNMYYRMKESGKEFKLSSKQIEACDRIITFIQQPRFEQCIVNNQYALYLLLRVAWMYYNESPLIDGVERQLTYLDDVAWDSIHRICEAYLDSPGNNKRPVVSLINALSVVQLRDDYFGALRILEDLNEDQFNSTPRMRVPFIICDSKGNPRNYTGTVLSINDKTKYNGRILVDGLPRNLDNHTGVRFTMKNLGLRQMPEEKEIIRNLELGIGYTGFSLYKNTKPFEGRE